MKGTFSEPLMMAVPIVLKEATSSLSLAAKAVLTIESTKATPKITVIAFNTCCFIALVLLSILPPELFNFCKRLSCSNLRTGSTQEVNSTV